MFYHESEYKTHVWVITKARSMLSIPPLLVRIQNPARPLTEVKIHPWWEQL